MLSKKMVPFVLLCVSFGVQADWWQSTKDSAGEAWDGTKKYSAEAWKSTKETVSEWSDDASKSDAVKEVKKLGEKETYVKAWEEAKKTSDNVLEKE
ncbi:hypothetical protein [Thiomicrorhabdus sp.]|uniref:hypothetical protein n=1 Tax=Thiomicrorhabdus sp. TaxID=2039724 RepID=UPI0029C8191D|nr:hypothetical protein [Thiomicrorhabdus sp.]